MCLIGIPGLFDAVIVARESPQTAITCIDLFGEFEQPLPLPCTSHCCPNIRMITGTTFF